MLLPVLISILAPVNAYYLPIEPVVLSYPIASKGKVKGDIQVTVQAKIVDSTQMDQLPQSRNFECLVRQGFLASPIRTETTLVAVDQNRTITGFEEIANIEVLKDGISSVYGRDAFQGVMNVLEKSNHELCISDTTIDPNKYAKDDGWTQVSVQYKFKDLFATTSVYQVTTEEGHEPKRDLLKEAEIYLGTYSCSTEPVINFQPDDSTFWGGKALNAYEAVGGVKFTPTYAQKIGIDGLYIPRLSARIGLNSDWTKGYTTSVNDYMQDAFKTYGQQNVMNWVGKSGLDVGHIGNMMKASAAKGLDMNKFFYPGYPDPSDYPQCGSEVYYPVGTIWLPDRIGYQGMVNYTPLRHQYFYEMASIDGGVLQKQSEARIHCLNLNLKEPEDGVRYFPYAPSDPLVAELEKVAAASNFRGPWDQARTWIYSDRASMDEINKRVMLGIRPSHYVNALWEVVSRGGFGPKDMANKKIFDPKLLACAGAKKAPMQWFVTTMGANFGKDVRAWLESGPQDFGALLSGKEEYEKTHVPTVLSMLLSSPDSDARMGALSFLKKIGPSSPLLMDKLGDFRASLYSSDSSEVEAALEACGRFCTSKPAEALRYLAQNGKNDKIKSAAKAMLSS